MVALEASPVAQAIITFIANRQEWVGTATELLKAITPSPDDRPRAEQTKWPTKGRGMSAVLTRLAPALRRVGICIEHRERTAKGRQMRLVYKMPAQPSQPSESSEPSCGACLRDDGSNRGDGSTDTATSNRHQPTPESSNEFNAGDDSDDSDGCAGAPHTPGPPPWETRL
jgi:hypothetical protein